MATWAMWEQEQMKKAFEKCYRQIQRDLKDVEINSAVLELTISYDPDGDDTFHFYNSPDCGRVTSLYNFQGKGLHYCNTGMNQTTVFKRTVRVFFFSEPITKIAVFKKNNEEHDLTNRTSVAAFAMLPADFKYYFIV